jgi:septal ring factor EnvC (AmiA/AmiB activator)
VTAQAWEKWTCRTDKVLRAFHQQLTAIASDVAKLSSSQEQPGRVEGQVKALNARLGGLAQSISVLEAKLARIEEKLSASVIELTDVLPDDKGRVERRSFIRRLLS